MAQREADGKQEQEPDERAAAGNGKFHEGHEYGNAHNVGVFLYHLPCLYRSLLDNQLGRSDRAAAYNQR